MAYTKAQRLKARRAYLKLGRSRTLATVSEMTGVKMRTLHRWSSEDDWALAARRLDGRERPVEASSKATRQQVIDECERLLAWARAGRPCTLREWVRDHPLPDRSKPSIDDLML